MEGVKVSMSWVSYSQAAYDSLTAISLLTSGLVGVGSDDPALLDLNPAEKKAVKAAKIQDAKKREVARQQE